MNFLCHFKGQKKIIFAHKAYFRVNTVQATSTRL
jgi:hypothetical protein